MEQIKKKNLTKKNDKTISLAFEFNKISKLLVGKKPPEEINVMAKFKESNNNIHKFQ